MKVIQNLTNRLKGHHSGVLSKKPIAIADSADGGNSESRVEFVQGAAECKGKLDLGERDKLEHGAYAGVAFKENVNMEKFDTVQLTIQTDGKDYLVKLLEHDSVTLRDIYYRALVVDRSKREQVLELPFALFHTGYQRGESEFVGKKYPKSVYSAISLYQLSILQVQSSEPFQFKLKDFRLLERGGLAKKLVGVYRRPIFLRQPNYGDLRVLDNGREQLQLIN